MNHRRMLRASTDAGLMIFVVMIIGVVLWTTDEVLNWNILPDWIDAYAQLLVIIFVILAGFAVITSVMCSFAVLAESAAERAGIPNPLPSQRARVLIGLGCVIAATIMFGLHKIDQHREAKRVAEARGKHKQRYFKNQAMLRERVPGVLQGFTPDLTPTLDDAGAEQSDKALARLLKAVHISTPLAPGVSVMIPAEAPYKYCILKALPNPRQVAGGRREFLSREYLIDLPKVWERDTVAALFKGQKLTVPHSRRGAFIDTWNPSAWGFVMDGESVIAIVMLRASQQ